MKWIMILLVCALCGCVVAPPRFEELRVVKNFTNGCLVKRSDCCCK